VSKHLKLEGVRGCLWFEETVSQQVRWTVEYSYSALPTCLSVDRWAG
jgi:hypothetical protein